MKTNFVKGSSSQLLLLIIPVVSETFSRVWTDIFVAKPRNPLNTLTSFQLKWLERLLVYHLNEDTNLPAKFFVFPYGFRTGVSTETALHEFLWRIELSLAKKKKSALGIFLNIVGAFDNVTPKSIGDALRESEMSPFLITVVGSKFWAENRTSADVMTIFLIFS